MADVPAHLIGRSLAVFEYTNWRGETAVRRVIPDRVVWDEAPGYGYRPGLFLVGWCLTKGAERRFSMDPKHMRKPDNAAMSAHGVNILLQVR